MIGLETTESSKTILARQLATFPDSKRYCDAAMWFPFDGNELAGNTYEYYQNVALRTCQQCELTEQGEPEQQQ